MDNDLSQRAKNYGAFDAYRIWYLRNIMDQRLRALVVLLFLAQLSTCIAFWHVLFEG